MPAGNFRFQVERFSGGRSAWSCHEVPAGVRQKKKARKVAGLGVLYWQ